MIVLFFNILVTILVVLLHGSIEQTLFDAGASWTLAKLLPYILVLSAATTTLLLSLKNVKKKVFGILIGVVIFSAALGVDFKLHTIYQGDFSNNSKTVQTNSSQVERNALTVFTIPGCPFCHGSIEMLQTLKKRNPNLIINFLVSSSDSTSLDQYVKPIDGKFNLALLHDLKTLNKLQITGFPTFLFCDKNGKKFMWTNDSFGVPAKDFIEKSVK
jgi:thioredoxin-related protein